MKLYQIKKLMTTLEDRKSSHGHRSTELILWKWLHCQNQTTDSINFSSKFPSPFSPKQKSIPKFIIETQKILDSQSQTEQNNKVRDIVVNLWDSIMKMKTALYRHKKIWTNEWNKGPRDKSIQPQPLDFLAKLQKYTMYSTFQQNVLGKLDNHMQKNVTGS